MFVHQQADSPALSWLRNFQQSTDSLVVWFLGLAIIFFTTEPWGREFESCQLEYAAAAALAEAVIYEWGNETCRAAYFLCQAFRIIGLNLDGCRQWQKGEPLTLTRHSSWPQLSHSLSLSLTLSLTLSLSFSLGLLIPHSCSAFALKIIQQKHS